jgi:protein gp37
MSIRLKAMGLEKYANGFEITLHPDLLLDPYSWKAPRMVFVNSMSDLFHEKIPTDFIQQVFKVMNENPKHIFQVLTKRAERLTEINDKVNWTENIWLGVTIEDEKQIERLDKLKTVNAKTKFLSCEPLLSSLKSINLEQIDWVIVGGESGTGARPIQPLWVEEIKNSCEVYNTAFFFKQWGGVHKKKNGRELNGVVYNEMPKRYSEKREISVLM